MTAPLFLQNFTPADKTGGAPGFSTGFIAAATDPWGEAAGCRVYLRLNDLNGTPSTLIAFSANEVLSVSTVTRRREWAFGTVQGQAVQVKIAVENLATIGYEFKGCWACIQCGFASILEYHTFAQGKVSRVIFSTDNTLTLEIHDTVMDVLNYAIPRDVMYSDTANIGDVQPESIASGSKQYKNSTAPIIISSASQIVDETFVIEFTSPTTYKVILEDGDETQTSNVTTNFVVDSQTGTNVLVIPTGGWDLTAGSYATGDRFVFYSSMARNSTLLSAGYIVNDLLEFSSPFTAYDVITGAYYANVRYDTTTWTQILIDKLGIELGGLWKKGTPIRTLVQDALKTFHGAVYPTATGQMGIWALAPSAGVTVSLNGDPDLGPVEVLSATIEDDQTYLITSVTFEYFALDGEDASFTAVDDDPISLVDKSEVIKIGWRVRGLSVESACNQYLNRFKGGRKQYTINTTLAGAVADIGLGIGITEPELRLTVETTDVTEISLNLMGNSAQIKAHVDPVVLAQYAVVGTSLVGGTDLVW